MSKENRYNTTSESALGSGGSSGPASADKPVDAPAQPLDLAADDAGQLKRRLIAALAVFAGVLIYVNIIGWAWFGSTPILKSGVPMVLMLGAFGAYFVLSAQKKHTAAGATLLFAILVAWHVCFGEMWMRWFPGWRFENAPLTTRLTAGDSYYTHGPIVPIACAVIAVLIYFRVGIPTEQTKSSRRWGSFLFGGSLLLQFVAARGEVNFASGIALIGILGSLVLLWGGWPLVRAYWLPIVFLLFMVPFPMDLIHKLNYQLKELASDSAAFITTKVFGVFAHVEGSTVWLEADKVTGEDKKLVVENVCSGLRSLISLVCFGSLFALICRVKGYWRWFMLAMTVPLAIACNIVRITSMNLVAHHFSVEAAGEESWFHTFSGIMVFALALAAMFGLERLIIWASHRWKKNWVDDRLLGYLDELPASNNKQLRSYHPVAVSLLMIVMVYTLLWAYEPALGHRGDIARQAVPERLTIAGRPYVGTNQEMSVLEQTILQTSDYLRREYVTYSTTGQQQDKADLTIVFSANNRKGTHPPEVCLEGSGGRVISKRVHPIEFMGIDDENKPVKRQTELRELISEKGQFQVLHMYVYKCGEAYTNSYLKQQFIIFLNGILNRNSTGALIRIDVLIGRPDAVKEEEARKLALDAAAAFMPEIDKGLSVQAMEAHKAKPPKSDAKTEAVKASAQR